MPATVTTRAATEVERRRLRDKHPGLAPTVIGIGLGFLVGWGLGAIAGFDPPIALLCGALWVVACILFSRDTFSLHRDRQRDLAENLVEVIEIDGTTPVEVETPGLEPAFAYELSSDRTLLLVGDWLPEDFPTTALRLTRFPRTGAVVAFASSGSVVSEPTSGTTAIRVPGDRQSYMLATASS